MARVYLVIGSVHGTAAGVAESVRARLASVGHEVVSDSPPTVDAMSGSGSDAVLVCTSTTGRGDIPASLVPFYLELEEKFPFQSGKPFGVISLGDSSYDRTFCAAGALFEERFLELQASQPVPRITIDATETAMPDEDALFWLDEWIQKALKT